VVTLAQAFRGKKELRRGTINHCKRSRRDTMVTPRNPSLPKPHSYDNINKKIPIDMVMSLLDVKLAMTPGLLTWFWSQ